VSPDTPRPAPETTLPPLREVIARHGLSARRSLGQHFLLDMNLTRRIARSAGPLGGCTVVEIGPGPGGLTRALLETAARKVVVIERDPRCRLALEQLGTTCSGRLVIVEADALKCDPVAVAGAGGPCVIVANLPYNIGTRLLLGWLRNLSGIASMTLMFQKEVAERIVAAPGTASYGRLSVITQWLCEARALFDISPRAFVPPPKVTSTVVKLAARSEPLAPASFADLEAVTAAAFGQRRKMLRSALRSLGGDPAPMLETANIRSDRRAETLSIQEFCALARARAARRETVAQ
jgi:16S rRNA (adenine1518-N6/adenine1519-N6)-dimethyltransferase